MRMTERRKDVSELWGRACSHLKELLHPNIYSRWIDVITPRSIEDNNLTLGVDNDFYQTWLEDNYLDLIKKAVESVSGFEPNIYFSINPQSQTQEQSSEARAPPQRREEASRVVPINKRAIGFPVNDKRSTFDNFVVGPSNDFAHGAALAVAQNPVKEYNPLFIYGPSGLGKTHLAKAIGHHFLQNSGKTVLYSAAEGFGNEYVIGLKEKNLENFRKKFRKAGLLIIDDVQFLGNKTKFCEEFFHTFNALLLNGGQLVMTSDRPPSEIDGLEGRLISRLESGLVADIMPPELETRAGIIREKAAQRGSPVSEEAATYIAGNIRYNIRRLEGALNRVTAYEKLTSRPATGDRLKTLLRDTIDEEPSLTPEIISSTVADYYGVRVSDLKGKCRERRIARPRQIAMYLCDRLTEDTQGVIGTYFEKTHATVNHAYKLINKLTAEDKPLHRDLDNITRKLLGQESGAYRKKVTSN